MKTIWGKIAAVFLSFVLFLSPVFSSTSLAAYNTTKTVATKATSTNETDKYIYYSVYNKIYRVNKKTKAKKLIHTVKRGGFSDITVYKNYIYCTINLCYGSGESYCYIYRVKVDGTNSKYITQGQTPIVCGDKIYYTRLSFDSKLSTNFIYDGKIKYLGLYKMNLNGSNKIRLDSSAEFCREYYKSYIYYSNDKGTYRISTNGKNKTKIFNNEDMHVFGIYGDYIYYNSSYYVSNSLYNEYGIFKYNIKTKKTTKILSNTRGYDLDNGYIYYTTLKNNKNYMYKMNLSSKKKTRLAWEKTICDIIVRGDYIMYECYTSESYPYNHTMNIIKTNGKEKKLLYKGY